MAQERERPQAADTGEQARLEDEGTALLRAAGCFRRGTGVKNPKSELETSRGEARWEEWMTRRVVEFYRHPCEDLAALAAILRLTADQQQALRHRRVEELTLGETAKAMGVPVWRVRVLLKQAERKCSLRRHDPPVSARALFWQDIRQKQASVYRRPPKARARSKKDVRKLMQESRWSAAARSAHRDWS